MKLYHVSQEGFLGNEVTFCPRIPLDRANGENDTIPRISVALSISDCVAGMVGCSAREFNPRYDHEEEYPNLGYVYEALGPCQPFDPRGYVPDSHTTGELWLTVVTQFRYVGAIQIWNLQRGVEVWRELNEA